MIAHKNDQNTEPDLIWYTEHLRSVPPGEENLLGNNNLGMLS